MGIVFVGIPFYTLAKYRGMAEAVGTLRAAGIVDRLKEADPEVVDIGDVDCPLFEMDTGPGNVRNFDHFLEGSGRVRSKLSEGVDGSKLTFCLGGECAFVVGSLAALKTVHKGRPGIVWLDAHGDFNTPETTPSGFIGGMPLALACGRGPKLSPEIEASRPLLDERGVVHVGSRALDKGEDEALQSSVKVFSASDVRKKGASKIARDAAHYLDDSCDWIVAHLDVDVFDPSVMPSVNFPERGGLSGNDVHVMFRSLHETGKLKVIDFTAYNPSRDVENTGRSFILALAPKLVST